MADAESRPRRQAPGLPLPDTVALVLQGGGALGAYQAGVIDELQGAGIEVDWVAGISIGAVNAALFAGNPPEKRIAAIRTFWEDATAALPDFSLPMHDAARELSHEWAAGMVMLGGVPGFFRPRLLPPGFAVPGTPEALSFYDTAPLRETLDRLVDWDLLNKGPVRLSVGAVDIKSGNFRYFDTRDERLDARHIMASGALPPGLPPVEIDGCWYWDGGLVSNTPLTHVLDRQDAETLIFQVDLFPAADELPRTITDVLAREKEIRFSSRTRAVSDERMRLRQERQMVCRLLSKLPPELLEDPEVQAVRARVSEFPVSLVHLIYRANAWEGGARDFEFSARSMHEHWQAGRMAVAETMANARLVAQNILDGNTAAFDLTQRQEYPMFLKGKSAIITGSTSGIGLAYAKALAAEGASVMINGFGDAAAIEKERAALEATSGAKALYDAADMTKPDQIAAMVQRCHDELGGPHIVINNAGIQHVSPIEDFPVEKYDAIVAINMSSAWHMTRAAVPFMKAQKWGRIISTASAHSLVASPNKSAYVMAKHAIAGLTKTIALEVATSGITVNCVSPGYVWTPLVENQIPDTMKTRNMTREQVINDVLLDAQPTKEFVQPEQVAALVLFLCRDEAAQITGANYSIDGGWTAA